MTLTLGILLCDDHYPESQAVYGHYDDAFKRLFENSAITSFVTYRVFEDAFPASPSECDVWLVTGSKWACMKAILGLLNSSTLCNAATKKAKR